MVSTPFVLKRNSDDWLMWYLSGIGWKSIEPPVSDDIKVARSGDGVNWSRDGTTAFDFEGEETNPASPLCLAIRPGVFGYVLCRLSRELLRLA